MDVCSETYDELRNTCILLTLIDTGARASELLALNICDVDLRTGSVQILKGKGNKFRTVWLGKRSGRFLSNYLDHRNAGQDEPLFLNDENRRLKYFGLRMVITRLCKKAKIKYYSPHCFRRVCALTLYRKTRDIYFVSHYLGHSSPEVTRRYLNVNNEDLRDSFISNSPGDLLD